MKLDLQAVASQVQLTNRATPRQEAIVIANLLQDEVLKTRPEGMDINLWLWQTNLLELALVEELKKRKLGYVGNKTRREMQAARTTLAPEHHLGNAGECIRSKAKEILDELESDVGKREAGREGPGFGEAARFGPGAVSQHT